MLLNEIVASNQRGLTDAVGETSDWVELYNPGPDSLDLAGYYLSDSENTPTKWQFSGGTIPADGYLLIRASGRDTTFPVGELHTNFRISSGGEALFLSAPDSRLLDESPRRVLAPDRSLGRDPDTGDWVVFSSPTPGAANTSRPLAPRLDPPIHSAPGGRYPGPLTVRIAPAAPDHLIHYTLDGSGPTLDSPRYTGTPIAIDTTTVLRSRGFKPGESTSRTTTTTYLIGVQTDLPIVSLAISPENFNGPTGINTNYNSGEEVPIHFELFERSGGGVGQDLGVKIHAPDQRGQRSLRFYARALYGDNDLDYPLFEADAPRSFKRFLLRNTGNDATELGGTHLRDAFVHRLYGGIDPTYARAAYRPVRTYLNGRYYGLYNLRERQDAHYIESRYGYKEDEIDFLEYDFFAPDNRKAIAGDWEDWDELRAFVQGNDMSDSTVFSRVAERVELTNFLDYHLTGIFVGNTDWIANNVKFWRAREAGSKWRWVLWDMDFAFGLASHAPEGQPEYGYLQRALRFAGYGNGDYGWLLRNLMKNEDFRERFAVRYQDLLNSHFSVEHLQTEFEETAAVIAPELPEQIARWGVSPGVNGAAYDNLRGFLAERPEAARFNLATYLQATGAVGEVTVEVADASAGRVQVNSLTIEEETPGVDGPGYPWRGTYFADYPTIIRAVPAPEHRFVRWEGSIDSTQPELSLLLTDTVLLRAVFERIPNPPTSAPAAAPRETAVRVFPNPAREEVYVYLRAGSAVERGETSYVLANIAGGTLSRRFAAAGGTNLSRLPVGDLPNGTYVLSVERSGRVVESRLVIIAR